MLTWKSGLDGCGWLETHTMSWVTSLTSPANGNFLTSRSVVLFFLCDVDKIFPVMRRPKVD